MNLQPDEVTQFYRIMHSLLFFVNQRKGISSEVSTLEEFVASGLDMKTASRNALYEDPELIEVFAKANPDHLCGEDIEIVRSWRKGHRRGNFFIERHLRKHSIWIGSGDDGNDTTFCVRGLSQPLDELIPKSALPHYVEAVLLPFKDHIVYDGFLGHHRISFGGSYRARLRETYMRAKQNGKLIESLTDSGEAKPAPPRVTARSWKREVTSLKKSVAKLKGEKRPIVKEAFAVCREGVELVAAATANPDDIENIRAYGYSVAKALRRLEKVLDRAEWR